MRSNTSKQLTIHGAWWIRDETLDLAVHRVNRTFISLSELYPDWRCWYLFPGSLQFLDEPERALMDDLDLIREALLSSQQATDGGPYDYDLGYSLDASSEPIDGRSFERSKFYVSCCHLSKYAGFNILSINLPPHESAPDLYDLGVLGRAIDILVDIWDPDWLSVWDLRTNLMPEPWPPTPVFGWINYLANRIGTVPDDLSAGWDWFAKRENKQIFIYKAGPPDEHNATHAIAFKKMFQCIQWKVK
jgi:hypothetical protein